MDNADPNGTPDNAQDQNETGIQLPPGAEEALAKAGFTFTEPGKASDIPDDAMAPQGRTYRSRVEEILDNAVWDGTRFWVRKEPGGVWTPRTQTQWAAYLGSVHKIVGGRDKKTGVNRQHDLTEMVVSERCVAYAGEVAGWGRGIQTMGDQRILVPRGPSLVTPAEGDWSGIETLLRDILGAQHEDPLAETQFHRLVAWLRDGAKAMHGVDRGPGAQPGGRALILAGERWSWKTTIQEDVITPILGGRAAKPARYLFGDSRFNGEMVGAEHLMLGDEALRSRKSRLVFAETIKQICAERSHTVEAKGRDAALVHPIWRVSMAANIESAAVLAAPDVREDTVDKVLVLRTYPIGRGDVTVLRRELPAFVHYLLNSETDEAHQGRFGVQDFQHPGVVQAQTIHGPEGELLSIFDANVFEGEPSTRMWEGSAHEFAEACGGRGVGFDLWPYIATPIAAGRTLGKLSVALPSRVASRKSHGMRTWLIGRPEQ